MIGLARQYQNLLHERTRFKLSFYNIDNIRLNSLTRLLTGLEDDALILAPACRGL